MAGLKLCIICLLIQFSSVQSNALCSSFGKINCTFMGWMESSVVTYYTASSCRGDQSIKTTCDSDDAGLSSLLLNDTCKNKAGCEFNISRCPHRSKVYRSASITYVCQLARGRSGLYVTLVSNVGDTVRTQKGRTKPEWRIANEDNVLLVGYVATRSVPFLIPVPVTAPAMSSSTLICVNFGHIQCSSGVINITEVAYFSGGQCNATSTPIQSCGEDSEATSLEYLKNKCNGCLMCKFAIVKCKTSGQAHLSSLIQYECSNGTTRTNITTTENTTDNTESTTVEINPQGTTATADMTTENTVDNHESTKVTIDPQATTPFEPKLKETTTLNVDYTKVISTADKSSIVTTPTNAVTAGKITTLDEHIETTPANGDSQPEIIIGSVGGTLILIIIVIILAVVFVRLWKNKYPRTRDRTTESSVSSLVERQNIHAEDLTDGHNCLMKSSDNYGYSVIQKNSCATKNKNAPSPIDDQSPELYTYAESVVTMPPGRGCLPTTEVASDSEEPSLVYENVSTKISDKDVEENTGNNECIGQSVSSFHHDTYGYSHMPGIQRHIPEKDFTYDQATSDDIAMTEYGYVQTPGPTRTIDENEKLLDMYTL